MRGHRCFPTHPDLKEIGVAFHLDLGNFKEEYDFEFSSFVFLFYFNRNCVLKNQDERERREKRERERSTGHVEGCMAEFIVNAGAK